MEIILPDVRLSFPSVFKAEPYEESPPRFSANVLVVKGSKTDAMIREAMEKVAKEKWPKNGAALLATAFKKDKTCYRDGDDKAAKYDGYEGNMYLTAIRQEKDGRPIVIDRNRAPVVEADGKIYSGCYVNLKVDLWAQDNQYGQTVRATLLVVQFVRDGDSFGGAKKPVADDMPELSVDETTAEGAGLL